MTNKRRGQGQRGRWGERRWRQGAGAGEREAETWRRDAGRVMEMEGQRQKGRREGWGQIQATK